MSVRQLITATLAFSLLGVASCSKTQDTAAEQRLFGSPPSIESVNVAGTTGSATCDITQTFEGFLCSLGVGPDAYTLSPGPSLLIEVTYSRTEFDVRVVDAEDTAAKSDILLVSASYLTPPEGNQKPEETSLILLDDGSETIFPFRQGSGAGENCTIDIANGVCACTGAEYQLTSNDPVKGDHMFTR